MGNSETKLSAPQPFIPDNTLVEVYFYFPDNPDAGNQSVKLALCSSIRHFKKLVQSMCEFPMKEYQVQYNSKLHSDNELFQSFWSNIDNKEVALIKPSISGV